MRFNLRDLRKRTQKSPRAWAMLSSDMVLLGDGSTVDVDSSVFANAVQLCGDLSTLSESATIKPLPKRTTVTHPVSAMKDPGCCGNSESERA